MIFPGFPGVLSFFQVFQVEWEPWFDPNLAIHFMGEKFCRRQLNSNSEKVVIFPRKKGRTAQIFIRAGGKKFHFQVLFLPLNLGFSFSTDIGC